MIVNRGERLMGVQRRPLPFELRPRTNEKAVSSCLGEEHSKLRAQPRLKVQGRDKLAKFDEQEKATRIVLDEARKVDWDHLT